MVTVNVIWNNTLEKLILHKIDVCLCAMKNDPKPLLSWIVYRSQVCNLYSGWRWNGASRTFLSVWIMWIIKWSFSFLEGNRATEKNCYIENTYRELIEKLFFREIHPLNARSTPLQISLCYSLSSLLSTSWHMVQISQVLFWTNKDLVISRNCTLI